MSNHIKCLLTICLLTVSLLSSAEDTPAPVEQEGSNFRRIERDLQGLQAFVYKHLGSEESPLDALREMPKDAASLMFDKLMSFQSQISKLVSRFEEFEAKLNQLEKEALADKKLLEDRLKQLEDHHKSAQNQAETTLPPEQLYEKAQILLKEGKKEEAEKLLTTIHNNHPESSVFKQATLDLVILMDNEGKFPEAAAFAMDIYKKDPQSAEAQQALLKMANVLHKMNKDVEACSVVAKLLVSPDLKPEFKTLAEALKVEIKCA
ncbi:MAG: outer membrane protein assembly factor BamD [Alphaproteobacteria bacterium]